MVRFIVAEGTYRKSIPHELATIVPPISAPKSALQSVCAFSRIASNTGVRPPGELLKNLQYLGGRGLLVQGLVTFRGKSAANSSLEQAHVGGQMTRGPPGLHIETLDQPHAPTHEGNMRAAQERASISIASNNRYFITILLKS